MDLVPLPVSYKRAPVCLCPAKRVAQNFVLFPTHGLVSKERADHYPSVLDTTDETDKTDLFGGHITWLTSAS